MIKENTASILFVDDESSILNSLKRTIRELPFEVHTATSGEAGLSILESSHIDLVVSDKNMPGMTGNEFLNKVAERWPETVRIMLTAYTELNDVITAINNGKIWGYIRKPWDNHELKLNLQQAMNYKDILAERSLLKHSLEQVKSKRKRNFMGFIGQSSRMQLVYNAIEMSSSSAASVFVTGKSGTGKELVASAIHELSARKEKPFICLNCAAIPSELMESEIFGHVKGAFSGAVSNRDGAAQQADGGTLFLDELGEMDISLQAKILRFIQTGTFQKVGSNKSESVDIRFISATNRNPKEAIADGLLREDLFYRLNVIAIDLPSLKARENDAGQIANFFIKHFSDLEQKVFVGLSSDAETLVNNYDWPGNVRQLENTIHSTIVMSKGPLLTGEQIGRTLQLNKQEVSELIHDTPVGVSVGVNLNSPDPKDVMQGRERNGIRPLAEVERIAIEHAITLCDDNVAKAASLLEVSPSTLYRKIQQWQD